MLYLASLYNCLNRIMFWIRGFYPLIDTYTILLIVIYPNQIKKLLCIVH